MARIRALVTLLPGVPTGGELGLGKLTITPWAGFFGPPGLPPPITDRLSREVQNTLQGFEGYGMSPDKFKGFFRQRYDASPGVSFPAGSAPIGGQA